jgi:hypothetical protein
MRFVLTPRQSVSVSLTGAAGTVAVGSPPAALCLVSIVRVGPQGIQGPPGPMGPAGGDGETFAATCLASVAVGQLVRVTGAGPLVAPVDIDDVAQMPAVGIVIDKPTPTTATVQVGGIATLSGLVAGGRYTVGPGAVLLLGGPPRPLSGQRAVQLCGEALDTTRLVLRFSSSFTLINP